MTNIDSPNPIHYLDDATPCHECDDGCYVCNQEGFFYPGWYFWDEVWTDRYGPFNTEQEARKALVEYCKQL